MLPRFLVVGGWVGGWDVSFVRVVITWCLSVQVSPEAASVSQRLMQRVEELSRQLAVPQYAVPGIGMRACLFYVSANGVLQSICTH